MNVEHGSQFSESTDDLLLQRYLDGPHMSKDGDGDGEEGGVCLAPEEGDERDDGDGGEGGVCIAPDEGDQKEDDGDGEEGGVCL